MKKMFKVIGICFLTCFSFYYTDKIIDFSKQKDPLMNEIINYQKKYNVIPVNAEVNGEYVIAGDSGSAIDVDKSYQKMKKLGEFNESLLVFINDNPEITIENNLDKYIIKSNKNEYLVSIMFVVKNSENLDKILNILKNNDVKTTFFVDGILLENKSLNTNKILEQGHNLGILEYNNSYKINDIKYMVNLIKQKDNSKIYCYTDMKNNELLDSCSKLKLNTILLPKIEKKLYYEVKNTLNTGNIYSISNSDNNIDNLDITIKYIKQKGYNIINVKELLDKS